MCTELKKNTLQRVVILTGNYLEKHFIFPRIKWHVHNNYRSCSSEMMEILHRHHREWLIHNHAWDPISGSALVDEPALNPEAWGHCQKAGFAASTACHLKNVSLH